MESKSNYISSNQLWAKVQASRSTRVASWLIVLLLSVAVLSNFIANDRPIYCKVEGQRYFPVFNDMGQSLGLSQAKHPHPGTEWYDLTYERALWPIIPFVGNTIDLENIYRPPFSGARKNQRFKHILGTGVLGKDVAAGLIQGTRIAMLVGIFSIFFAALIGLLIGGIAGFFGDHYLRMSWLNITGAVLGFLAFLYYTLLFYQLWAYDSLAIFNHALITLGSLALGIIMGACLFLVFYFIDRRIPKTTRQTIPLDLLLMRLIEIVQSIPALLILLVMAGMFATRSIWIVIFIIAFIKWTSIAKFVRAELLQIRSLEYIQAARSSGISEFKILMRHALPNALTPIYITIAFGIASAVLLESTISFLGIGLEQEIMSWGKMLSQARSKPSAWWLALFPGLMIFVCVISFNLVGDKLRSIYKG